MRKAVLLPTIKIVALLLIPIALWVAPREGIMSGNSICIFGNIFGNECWGCGFTRAAYLVLHGEFTAAWEQNKLIIVTIPLLSLLWLRSIVKETMHIAEHTMQPPKKALQKESERRRSLSHPTSPDKS